MKSLEGPILIHQSRDYFSASVSKGHRVGVGHLLVFYLSNVCCMWSVDWCIELCACFLVILQQLVHDMSVIVSNR